MTRRGFTLIELLVVVSVIGVLAGLLLPAVSMVRAQANKLKCANNMRNIVIGVMAYRTDNNDTFPGRFSELVSGYNLPTKILQCPVDKSRGLNPNMGRAVAWTPDLTRLFYLQIQGIPSVPPVTACSYDYECSGWIGGTTDQGSPILTQDDIDFFWLGLPASIPALGTVSWAQAKEVEQQFGNKNASGAYGFPFPSSSVPMIRCYHHYPWTGGTTDQTQDKVVNVSLEGNLIYTIPYWEHGVNPLIPY